jgi:hypothetical protein
MDTHFPCDCGDYCSDVYKIFGYWMRLDGQRADPQKQAASTGFYPSKKPNKVVKN